MQANYREKFNHAGQVQDPKTGEWKTDPSLSEVDIARKKLAVINELIGICKNVDKIMQENPNIYPTNGVSFSDWKHRVESTGVSNITPRLTVINITLTLQNDSQVSLRHNQYIDKLDFGTPGINEYGSPQYSSILMNKAYGGIDGLIQENNIRLMMGDILDVASKKEGGTIVSYTFTGKDGQTVQTTDRNQAIDHMFFEYVGQNADVKYRGEQEESNVGFIGSFFLMMAQGFYDSLSGAPVPLPGVPLAFTRTGYVLKQDKIPAMDRAAYIKVRRQLSDIVVVEAWKLNSFDEGTQDAHGLHDMQIADVLGIGTQIRLGKRSMLAFDCCQNRADMGKFFHGGRDAYGDYSGGGHTPDF